MQQRDLSQQSEHNRRIHIKWCGYKKKTAKRPAKESVAFTRYFSKKKVCDIDFSSSVEETVVCEKIVVCEKTVNANVEVVEDVVSDNVRM